VLISDYQRIWRLVYGYRHGSSISGTVLLQKQK